MARAAYQRVTDSGHAGAEGGGQPRRAPS